MTMTIPNATATAKAAQAEPTVSVAAPSPATTNGVSGSALAATPAGNRVSAANNSKGGAPTSSNTGVQPQPASTERSSQQLARAGAADNAGRSTLAPLTHANAAQVVAPLFAELLNSGDMVAPSTDERPESSNDTLGTTAVSDLLPAMISSMLNVPAPMPADPATSDATGADTISAISVLNSSSTRLNLAAVSVAVTPVAADTAAMPSVIAEPVLPVPHRNALPVASSAIQVESEQPLSVPATVDPDNIGSVLLAQVRPASPQLSLASQPRSPSRTTATGAKADATSNTAAPSIQPASARPAADLVAASSAASASRFAATNLGVSSPAGVDDDHGTPPSSAIAVGNGNLALGAPPATTPVSVSATVKLAGAPEQWQQPLREALGDRLQLQLQRNNDHAVIRLEPPNMGAIEISIRHSAGALQVNLSASNSEVVRQLNTISDGVRQDLSSRQFADVSVSVSSSRAQAQADQGQGRSGQQRGQDDGRTPGRALSDDDSTATFAMTGE